MARGRFHLAEKILGKIADLVINRPAWLAWPQLILFLLCPVITFLYLGFNTSRNDLVGDDKKYHQIYLKFLEEFESPEDLVVIVQSENFEKNREYIERLAARVNAETNTFHRTFYKGNLTSLGRKALFLRLKRWEGGELFLASARDATRAARYLRR